jgi:hypothetical protein
LIPSTLNCTPITFTLSDASAETVFVPDTVELFDGLVIATIGAVESGTGLFTVTSTGLRGLRISGGVARDGGQVKEPFCVYAGLHSRAVRRLRVLGSECVLPRRMSPAAGVIRRGRFDRQRADNLSAAGRGVIDTVGGVVSVT